VISEQHAAVSMRRTHDLLVKQHMQLSNMIRGLLSEFGVDIPSVLERALLVARPVDLMAVRALSSGFAKPFLH
jgi:transposase